MFVRYKIASLLGRFAQKNHNPDRKNINLFEMSKFRQVELLTNKYSNTK